MRLAVKDLFDTAGLRTTYGSAVYRDHVPTSTSPAVRRLEDAGYALVGKTNLHEFAYGITSENEHFGDVVNPLDRTRSPGGSSGGNAAALVAGMCDAALGTDTGGSVRIPAAWCGVVGFKPSYEVAQSEGVFPLAPSFDHVGAMARSVDECIAMTQALDALPSTPFDALRDLRVGVAWLEHADPLVARRVREAADRFGGVVEVDLPVAEDVVPVFMREVADTHRELFAEHRELYGSNVRTKIERCLAVADAEYERGLAARELLRARASEAWERTRVSLLLAPTTPTVAPRLGIPELDLRVGATRLTFPLNALGWPALALPCGAAEHGLPASLQLIARTFEDGLVLDAGVALERALASPV